MQQIRTTATLVASLLVFVVACAVPQFAYAADQTSGLAAGVVATQAPSVTYNAHVRGAGWQGARADGAAAGTGSNAKPIDALTLDVAGVPAGGVQYQVYVKDGGWQAVKSNGKVAGKISKKLGIEGVRIALTGDASSQYNVVYRVKQKGGKSKWASNGAVAGNVGKGKLVSAVEVKLEKKASHAAHGDGLVGIRYTAKVKKLGWSAWSVKNAVVGKTKKAQPATGLKVKLDKGTLNGDVLYSVKPVGGKWQAWKKNGASSGVYGSLEAIKVKLSGAVATSYDVVYRVKSRGIGWSKRTTNGGVAGAAKTGKSIQQIKINLVPKTSRAGWYGKKASWKYYEKGKALAGTWVETKESPIDPTMVKKQRYWIDTSGKLAVDRLINPKTALDKGAKHQAWATESGYVLRSVTTWIDDLDGWYTATKTGKLKVSTDSRVTHIERYVSWAIDIAEDDSHGYSQYNRWGADYDCSSLVVSALKNSGFSTGGATYTGNMRSELTKHGFKWHTNFSQLQRGDILLVHNSKRQHTEIYLGNGQTVGAHIAENGTIHGKTGDQTGHEIDVGPYYSIWSGYLRYKA